jgi:hypothetical protein
MLPGATVEWLSMTAILLALTEKTHSPLCRMVPRDVRRGRLVYGAWLVERQPDRRL